MNCIAVDDEALALNVITDFCSKIPFLNLIDTCPNAMEAVKLINKHEIDLIFLDIQMPYITGVEFCKTLVNTNSNAPLIIFTTAYSYYAIEGFELNAVDYLIKPIPFERFFQAVNKAYEYMGLRKKKNPVYTHEDVKIPPDYMMIKCEYSTIKVNFDSVLYIEGLKDYIKIYTDDKMLLTKSTMKNIEAKLPDNTFMRVHKSYIVSLPKIYKIENSRILFGDKRIPVGDQYKKAFHQLIDKYRL